MKFDFGGYISELYEILGYKNKLYSGLITYISDNVIDFSGNTDVIYI